MSWRFRIFIGIIAFFAAIVIFTICMCSVSARTITVDYHGGADHTSIQDAINVSEDGDTIRVFKGTYYAPVIVNRSVSLIGNGSGITNIYAGEKGDVVRIIADGVTVSGFLITDGTGNKGNDGIRIEANHTQLMSNNCSGNYNGISIIGSINSSITDSICSFNNNVGMYSQDCLDLTVENNSCMGNYIGIRLWGSNLTSISNNTCKENKGSGISLTRSENCTIERNDCSVNDLHGLSLYYSPGAFISLNIVSNNRFGGIDLFSSSSCIIEHTSMVGNGITIDGSFKDWTSHIIDTTNTVNGKPVRYYKNGICLGSYTLAN